MQAGLVIGQLSDRGNEASLVRTHEAFGGTHVHVVGQPERSLTSTVTRGAHRHVAIIHHENYGELVHWAHRHNGSLVAIEHCPDSEPIEEVDSYPVNPIFVPGNESQGVPERVIESADTIREVTQSPNGYMRCLNTATAGAIVLHDWFATMCKRDTQQYEFYAQEPQQHQQPQETQQT